MVAKKLKEEAEATSFLERSKAGGERFILSR